MKNLNTQELVSATRGQPESKRRDTEVREPHSTREFG
jgi:hypothetical protein